MTFKSIKEVFQDLDILGRRRRKEKDRIRQEAMEDIRKQVIDPIKAREVKDEVFDYPLIEELKKVNKEK